MIPPRSAVFFTGTFRGLAGEASLAAERAMVFIEGCFLVFDFMARPYPKAVLRGELATYG